MRRIAVGAGVLLGVLALVFVLRTALSPGRPPNLVIVMVDTLRSDHLACFGYPRLTMPQVESLLEDSALFTKHHAHASRTGPSVASLFTGLHPPSHGVVNPLTHFDAKGTLGEAQVTLAEVLKDHGYVCGGFVANFNVTARFGFGQGFDEYTWVESQLRRRELGGVADNVNVPVRAWIEHTEEPFFLYVHYLDPHSSYEAPPPFDTWFADSSYAGSLTGNHQQLDAIVAGAIRPTPEDVDHLKDLYDQEIRYVDAAIGRLFDVLKEQQLWDDTILVFVADHGEEFLEHGSVLHGYTVYEDQLRVPLIIRDPRRPAARTVERVTREVDLFPTLLELLDVPIPERVEGVSLVPLLENPAVTWPDLPVYAETSLRAVRTVRKESFAAGGWKLIRTTVPAPGLELFDLHADPGEQRNLVRTDPERTRRLLDGLDAFRSSMAPVVPDSVQLTEEERERLRSMGYLK